MPVWSQTSTPKSSKRAEWESWELICTTKAAKAQWSGTPSVLRHRGFFFSPYMLRVRCVCQPERGTVITGTGMVCPWVTCQEPVLNLRYFQGPDEDCLRTSQVNLNSLYCPYIVLILSIRRLLEDFLKDSKDSLRTSLIPCIVLILSLFCL